MKQIVLSMFTACAMLGATILGIPAAAEAQTIIIIQGNQPYYPQPYRYPYQHDVVYGYPGYYDAGYGDYGGYYGGGYGGYYGAGDGGTVAVTVATTVAGLTQPTGTGIADLIWPGMGTGIADLIGDGDDG